MTINVYYQNELRQLRDLGAEFSKIYPHMANMLEGPSADPDVERLLEGVAFLTGLLRHKLDDDFPEIVHELTHLVFPHYLRPIPSATILAFQPKPGLKQPISIPPGSLVASDRMVDNVKCRFQTCYPVEVFPISLENAVYVEPDGHPPVIRLTFQLKGIQLADFQPRDGLRIHLSGDYTDAADLYYILRNYVSRILMRTVGGKDQFVLGDGKSHFKPVGFGLGEGLFPYPTHAFPSYRLLQEFFILPEKFLFFDIKGFDRWVDREEGDRFEVDLELKYPKSGLPFPVPKVKGRHFTLYATPAINIFKHEAIPVVIDHRKAEYPISPGGSGSPHYQVYSVEKVTGYVQGTAREKPYLPFDHFNPEPTQFPVYRLRIRESAVHASGYQVFLMVAYPEARGTPKPETLSIDLLCTDGMMPENLNVADITSPTSDLPELVTFKNIIRPTPNQLPPLGKNLLWRFLSHLSLNYLTIANAANLKSLLSLYIFKESREKKKTLENEKRIEGIEGVEASKSNRIVDGILMRGRKVEIRMRHDHYPSHGDMYLLGCVLDFFLGTYASMNAFTELIIEETLKGDTFRWPPRIGTQHLI